jgi:hypothetical protein
MQDNIDDQTNRHRAYLAADGRALVLGDTGFIACRIEDEWHIGRPLFDADEIRAHFFLVEDRNEAEKLINEARVQASILLQKHLFAGWARTRRRRRSTTDPNRIAPEAGRTARSR